MKKIISLAAVLTVAATMAYAASNEVYSVNVVGFQKTSIDGRSQYAMVTSPFETGEQTLLDIFGTNSLQQGTTPAACDKIRFWNKDTQRYMSVAQYTDGQFYLLTASGEWDPGYIVTNPVVDVGVGFWINTAVAPDEEREFTFVGDVIMDQTNEIYLIDGYQIVSYPFSTSIALSNSSFSADGATKGSTPPTADQVRVWNKTTQSYQGYALYSDGLWYKLTSSGEWDPSYETSTHVFEQGESFWYRARNAFTWQETNPYYDTIND